MLKDKMSMPMNKLLCCEPGYWRSERMTITAINAKVKK